MAIITLRGVKGSPLSIEEVDTNFIEINTELGYKLNASTYTAEDILSKLTTVDGPGSLLDADTLDGYNSSLTTAPNTVVVRNLSSDIYANIVHAAFDGNLTGNTNGVHTGSVIGPVTGNVIGNLTGAVTGNVTGNVIGNLTGDVTGNLTGAVTGTITLTGALTTDSSAGTTGQLLVSRGTGSSPQWSSISSAVGTLTVGNGGTGLTSAGTAGNYLVSNGTSWVSQAPPAVTISSSAPSGGSNKDIWFRV